MTALLFSVVAHLVSLIAYVETKVACTMPVTDHIVPKKSYAEVVAAHVEFATYCTATLVACIVPTISHAEDAESHIASIAAYIASSTAYIEAMTFHRASKNPTYLP